MKRDYVHWHSRWLHRQMEALVFGHDGRPVLVFPTSMGRFYQFEDFGMVAALGNRLERGEIQLFCVDGVDEESWYNRDIEPRRRVLRHMDYERYVLDEFLPYLRRRNPHATDLTVTGCSFGAYHAVNLAFRHPELVKRAVGLGGRYEIRHMLGGYYDDDVYFNSPVDFMPGLNDPPLLGYLRQMEIVLAAGEHDICRESTQELSGILGARGIAHVLDIWGDGAGHDWPWWRGMIQKHL